MKVPPLLHNFPLYGTPISSVPNRNLLYLSLFHFKKRSLESFKKATLGLRHDLMLSFFVIAATISFIPVFTYAYFASDLDSKEKIMNRNDGGVILLDRNGQPFFNFYQARFRKEIPLSGIPEYTKNAFIAMEDKDFYSHPGFSPKAMVRAFVDNLRQEDVTYGASTITQQLIKNSLLTPRKDYLRKYQEIVLAQEVERKYSKDEILEMYLNSIYLGEGAFGVEEAALVYFDKSAKDLTLGESSLLAAILPAPSRLSPISGDFDEAKKRQKLVLDKMAEQKLITALQKEKATGEKINLSYVKDDMNSVGIHFALMVKDLLIKEYGEERVARSGFKVHTSLDLEKQQYAEKVISDQVKKLKGNRVTNGAAVVLDPKTGEILAMVGSKDWNDENIGKVNLALAPRPPGSAFKPIVYIAGFEKGIITPASILKDQPTTFANFNEQEFFGSFPTKAAAQQFLKNDPNAYYKPQNYDRRFRGPVTVRRALANSLNVPAVEVMSKVGLSDAMSMAERLGITTLREKDNYGLSFVLGTAEVKLLELTNIYATFANNGERVEPAPIIKIEDKLGKTIYQPEPKKEKVLDEEDAFLISSILSDNRARTEMFGNALTISRVAAVKTGTTEDYKDAWTLGYTPSLAVGVWVGNNYNEPMDRVAGSLGAAPIWRLLMEEFLKGTPVEKFEVPDDVVKVSSCGVKEAKQSAGIIEYFIKGTEPQGGCFPIPTPKPSESPSPSGSPSPTNSPPPSSDNQGGDGEEKRRERSEKSKDD